MSKINKYYLVKTSESFLVTEEAEDTNIETEVAPNEATNLPEVNAYINKTEPPIEPEELLCHLSDNLYLSVMTMEMTDDKLLEYIADGILTLKAKDLGSGDYNKEEKFIIFEDPVVTIDIIEVTEISKDAYDYLSNIIEEI